MCVTISSYQIDTGKFCFINRLQEVTMYFSTAKKLFEGDSGDGDSEGVFHVVSYLLFWQSWLKRDGVSNNSTT